MTIVHKTRFWFTTDGEGQGPGLGTVVMYPSIPSDAYWLPDLPGPQKSYEQFDRYYWHHADQEWKIYANAKPEHLPEEFYSWNWQERYVVDESDPDRNSWVLKPDAEPVEPPNP